MEHLPIKVLITNISKVKNTFQKGRIFHLKLQGLVCMGLSLQILHLSNADLKIIAKLDQANCFV